jgi:hypothetical protein
MASVRGNINMRGRIQIGTIAVVVALAAGCGSSGSGGAGGSGGSGGGQDGAIDRGEISPGGDVSGGDSGNQTCGSCFLKGSWKIDNLSPCFVSTAPAADGGASMLAAVVSTYLEAGTSRCPEDPAALITRPWSTSTLTTDCPGRYHLCVTLKAGDAKMPGAGDCTVVQSCADDQYAVANLAQMWATLPGWRVADAALPCAQKMRDQGGYAQLTVSGTADQCGAIQKTLSVVGYCPLSCKATPNIPECMNCKTGGGGTF